MATKNQIIETLVTKVHDPDEPLFLLRGRDPLAADTVDYWATSAKREGVNLIKIEEALNVRSLMQEYEPKKKPD